MATWRERRPAEAVWDFFGELTTERSQQWHRHIVGDATVESSDGRLRFAKHRTSSRRYTDSQIDDYHGLPRREFSWKPPLVCTIRARFSHPAGVLSGTAGFGFWNDPFAMTGGRPPALPRAIWFFYASTPSNMKLDIDTPGHGWKAAVIDASRLSFLLLAPAAPMAVLLMKARPLYRRMWPIWQRAAGIGESSIRADMTTWHTYVIEWRADGARFCVDGSCVFSSDRAPSGPLGFVAWLDNQYAVVTPWGRFGYGWLESAGPEWMELDTLRIQRQSNNSEPVAEA